MADCEVDELWIENLLKNEEQNVILTKPQKAHIIQLNTAPCSENGYTSSAFIHDKQYFIKVFFSPDSIKTYLKKSMQVTAEKYLELGGSCVNLTKYEIHPFIQCNKNLCEFQLHVCEFESFGLKTSAPFNDNITSVSKCVLFRRQLVLLWRQLQIQKLGHPDLSSLLQEKYKRISADQAETLDQMPEWKLDFVKEQPASNSSLIEFSENQTKSSGSSLRNSLKSTSMGNSASNHSCVQNQNGVQSCSASNDNCDYEEIDIDLSQFANVHDDEKNHDEEIVAVINQHNAEAINDTLKKEAIKVVPDDAKGYPTSGIPDVEQPFTKTNHVPGLVKTIIPSDPDVDFNFIEPSQGFELSADIANTPGFLKPSPDEISSGDANCLMSENIPTDTANSNRALNSDGTVCVVSCQYSPIHQPLSDNLYQNANKVLLNEDLNNSASTSPSDAGGVDAARVAENTSYVDEIILSSDESVGSENQDHEILFDSRRVPRADKLKASKVANKGVCRKEKAPCETDVDVCKDWLSSPSSELEPSISQDDGSTNELSSQSESFGIDEPAGNDKPSFKVVEHEEKATEEFFNVSVGDSQNTPSMSQMLKCVIDSKHGPVEQMAEQKEEETNLAFGNSQNTPSMSQMVKCIIDSKHGLVGQMAEQKEEETDTAFGDSQNTPSMSQMLKCVIDSKHGPVEQMAEQKEEETNLAFGNSQNTPSMSQMVKCIIDSKHGLVGQMAEQKEEETDTAFGISQNTPSMSQVVKCVMDLTHGPVGQMAEQKEEETDTAFGISQNTPSMSQMVKCIIDSKHGLVGQMEEQKEEETDTAFGISQNTPSMSQMVKCVMDLTHGPVGQMAEQKEEETDTAFGISQNTPSMSQVVKCVIDSLPCDIGEARKEQGNETEKSFNMVFRDSQNTPSMSQIVNCIRNSHPGPAGQIIEENKKEKGISSYVAYGDSQNTPSLSQIVHCVAASHPKIMVEKNQKAADPSLKVVLFSDSKDMSSVSEIIGSQSDDEDKGQENMNLTNSDSQNSPSMLPAVECLYSSKTYPIIVQSHNERETKKEISSDINCCELQVSPSMLNVVDLLADPPTDPFISQNELWLTKQGGETDEEYCNEISNVSSPVSQSDEHHFDCNSNSFPLFSPAQYVGDERESERSDFGYLTTNRHETYKPSDDPVKKCATNCVNESEWRVRNKEKDAVEMQSNSKRVFKRKRRASKQSGNRKEETSTSTDGTISKEGDDCFSRTNERQLLLNSPKYARNYPVAFGDINVQLSKRKHSEEERKSKRLRTNSTHGRDELSSKRNGIKQNSQILTSEERQQSVKAAKPTCVEDSEQQENEWPSPEIRKSILNFWTSQKVTEKPIDYSCFAKFHPKN